MVYGDPRRHVQGLVLRHVDHQQIPASSCSRSASTRGFRRRRSAVDNFLTFSVCIGRSTLMQLDNPCHCFAYARQPRARNVGVPRGLVLIHRPLRSRSGARIAWLFRLFYYVMPLKWTFGSAGYDVFMPSDFTGAETCVPGAAITYSDGTAATCSSAGFYCDGMQSSFGCWGRDRRAGSRHPAQVVPDHLRRPPRQGPRGPPRDAVAALKLAYIFILTIKVSATDSPQKPAKATTKTK